MTASTPPASDPLVASHRRRAVIASTVGTTIEWYDFFLYGTMAALILPCVFFPAARRTPALIADSFGTNLRYSSAGLGYQLASVIAGGPAPLIAAWILKNTGSSTWISAYIVGCCVVAFIALLLMPRWTETSPTTDYDAAVERGAAAALSSGRR